MTSFRKSVPAPTGVGAGAPTPKKGKITIIYADDVLVFPVRDANGVKMLGNIVLKAGAVMHELYLTPSSQKASYTVEGDEDMEGFLPAFEASHPGDELAINEFVQNGLGVGFIAVFGLGCGTNQGKVMGSPCNPLKMTPEFTDDKDGTKTSLMFKQTVKSREIPGFYDGTTSYAVYPVAATADVDVLKATGDVYQLPSAAVVDEITADSIDLDAGTLVSFIGGGGANPSTLSKGVQGQVTVMLKDGTQWIALDKATITLEVFKDDAATYLIERERTA